MSGALKSSAQQINEFGYLIEMSFLQILQIRYRALSGGLYAPIIINESFYVDHSAHLTKATIFNKLTANVALY